MVDIKHLTGPCNACGAMIRFPATSIGTTIQCPYCRKPTELTLAPPVQGPAISRRAIILAVITAVILVVGVVGIFIALHRAQDWAARNRPIPPASNTNR